MITNQASAGWRGTAAPWRPTAPLFLLQPLLKRIVRHVARRHPELMTRLGEHQKSRFIIDPKDLPFVLYLRADPQRPELRAMARRTLPTHDARITATLFQLVRMIDGQQDGDALFFSRDLAITGNTEAVVSLRNAIDNVDGSLAATVADMFGGPGRIVLVLMRRRARSRFA